VTDLGVKVTSLGLDKKKELGVKKHTAIIHCSNTLSLLQRKISNALLYNAYHNLMTHEEHEITVKNLCNLISYHGNNHAVIKDALKGLISTVLEWNLIDENSKAEDWTASAILASVHLKGALCTYAYSPRMKKLLYNPSMFGKLNLYIQAHFRSSYGLALYENCTRYQNLPFTRWFDLAMFRKLMGVPDDNYKIFRDFKKRVLDKAIEEVNSFSDLFIEPEFQKRGRQIIKIRFSLKVRNKKKRIGTNPEPIKSATNEQTDLFSKLTVTFGLEADIVQKLLKDYHLDYISEKIQMIEKSKSFLQGKINNPAGLLFEALKSDYKEKPQSPRAALLPAKKEKKEGESRVGERRKRQQEKELIRVIDDMELEERNLLLTEFKRYLGKSLYSDIYKRDGLKNILIQGQLFEFTQLRKPMLFERIALLVE
jgi:plasmid replication initiation protein